MRQFDIREWEQIESQIEDLDDTMVALKKARSTAADPSFWKILESINQLIEMAQDVQIALMQECAKLLCDREG